MTIKDMLVGHGGGDSFGVGVEFSSREWIHANVDFTCFVNNRKGIYAEGYEEGRYSDDCEETVGSMKAMMDGREMMAELLLEYWLAEYNAFKKEHGIPRIGQGSIQQYFEGESTIEEVRGLQWKKRYPGNAPPMRALPFGFAGANLERYAIINADATHPHSKARAASIIIARATEFFLVNDGEEKDVFRYCLPEIREMDRETADYLERVESLDSELREQDYEVVCGPQPVPDFPVPNMYGMNADAMRTAGATLHTLKHATDPFDALQRSINYGGDVDSLAAIAVGIMAGRHGLSSLPSFLIDKLEGREYLERVAERFERHVL